MATYSDAELELMTADLESDFVERKESAADGRRIRRDICAFANDLPGNGRPGVVLVGVRDDGTCFRCRSTTTCWCGCPTFTVRATSCRFLR